MKKNICQKILRKNVFLFFVIFFSCEDFIDVGLPKTQTITATVYSSDVTAISAVSGIYSQMVNLQSFAGGGEGSVTMLAGLSSDEFVGYGENRKLFEMNSLLSTTTEVRTKLWEPAYKLIYYANSVLQGLSNSSGVTAPVKNQLEGEVKFIRAFCHFHLMNLFGEVPLITTTDYRVNAIAHRASEEEVYQQIIADLEDAQKLLAEDYSHSNQLRIRPNKWAATAMLARVYLYMNEWGNAETHATSVINNTTMFSLPTDLNSVFLNNSTEAIWQLKPVAPGRNTNEGQVFIVTSTPLWVSLTSSLVNAFEVGDNRGNNWVNSVTSGIFTYYYPYKYKIGTAGQPITEFSMVLRLAEQYLIRAEARAQQTNIPGAQADVNIVRNRAGLANTTAATQTELLSAIKQERRIELFSEWGHRWFDLKRTGKADATLSPLKSENWQSDDALYPIPQSERENNPNLSQNDGY